MTGVLSTPKIDKSIKKAEEKSEKRRTKEREKRRGRKEKGRESFLMEHNRVEILTELDEQQAKQQGCI